MISVIIPTYKRHDFAERCVRSVRETAPDAECIVVMDVDADEIQRYESLNAKVIFNPEKIGAINAWNKGLQAAGGSHIVFAGDDLVFIGDWWSKALEAHRSILNGYGLVGFNDNHNNGNNIATHYLADRKFIIDVLGGRIAFPMYNFYCNDSTATLMAQNSGHYYWCKEAIVRHDHPANGRRRIDENDNRNTQNTEHDNAEYFAWIERGAKIEWEPLISH